MMLADVGEEVTEMTFDTMMDGLLGIGGSVLDFISNNPLMLLCFSGCLVGVACYVVRRVKKTAIR